jgi:hypothetical protein
MNKKLILGLALAVVLASGSMFSARSEVIIDKDVSTNSNIPYVLPADGGLG